MKTLTFLLILIILGVISSTASVAIDKNDTIYVSSLGATTRDSGFILRIDKYDSNGKESAEVTEVITSKENEPIGSILSMAFNSKNDLFIADSSRRQILKLNIGSNIVTESEASGTGTFYENNAGVKVNRITDSSVEVIVNQLHEEGMGGDGFEAINATLLRPNIIVFDKEDNLYISDSIITSTAYRGDTINEATNDTGDSSYSDFLLKEAETALSNRIRVVEGGKPEGKITLFAGTGLEKYSGDGNTALTTNIGYPGAMIVGNDGEFYVSSFLENKFLKIHNIIPKQSKKQYVEGDEHYSFPQIFNGEIAVPSEDGNFMFIFDKKGRHDRTVNLVKNHLEYKFKYGEYENQNGNGDKKVWYLNEIVECDYSREYEGNNGKPDCYGDTVSITRESNTGVASEITASNGEITTLSINNHVLDKITKNNNVNHDFLYTDGLMTSFRNADQYEYQYMYGDQEDKKGLLEEIFKPGIGLSFKFSRIGDNDNYTLTATSPTGTKTIQEVKRDSSNFNHVSIKTTFGTNTETSYFKTYTEGVPKKKVVQDDGTEIYVVDTSLSLSQKTIDSNGEKVTTLLSKHEDNRIGILSIGDSITDTDNNGKITFSSIFYDLNIDSNGIMRSKKVEKSKTGVSKKVHLYEYNSGSSIETFESYLFEDSSYKLTSKEIKEFHGNGKIDKITESSNNALEKVSKFDENGRAISVKEGSRKIIYTRNSKGRITSIKTPEGILNYGYNSSNRIDSIESLGEDIPVEYSIGGNATKFGDSNLAYNSMDKLMSINDISYEYNDDQQLSKVINGLGETSLIYDDNYLKKVTLSEINDVSASEVNYYYNNKSFDLENLNSIERYCSDSSNCTENFYGFIDSEIKRYVSENGLIDRFTFKNGTNTPEVISYEFNSKGQILKAKDLIFEPKENNITESTLKFNNDIYTKSIITKNKYNNITSQVINKHIDNVDTIILDIKYTRDSAGRVIGKTEKIDDKTFITTYQYQNNKLIKERGVDILTPTEAYYERDYTYDSSGSITHDYIDERLVENNYTNGKLMSFGDKQYEYDTAGNLKKIIDATNLERMKTSEFYYDSLNMLDSVLIKREYRVLNAFNVNSFTKIEYENDALGRRLGKSVTTIICKDDQSETDCLNDTTNATNKKYGYSDYYQYFANYTRPIARFINGKHVVTYVYGNDMKTLEYLIFFGEKYKVTTDHRGSVVLVQHVETGKVMERHSYTAYGKLIQEQEFIASAWVPINFGFMGGLIDDETGLINFGARDMSPDMERWIQKSSKASKVSNPYVLFNADPINVANPMTNSLLAFTIPIDFKAIGRELLSEFADRARESFIDMMLSRINKGLLKKAMVLSEIFAIAYEGTTLIRGGLGYSYTDVEFENYIVPVFKYRKGMSKREFAHRLYNLIIRAKGVVSPISDLIGENSSSTALTTTNSLPATTGTRAVTRTTGLTKTKKSDIEAPKNEDGHPDECLAGLKVNDPIFQTTANKVGITKERVEELLSRKGICTGDIGAIDFLADLFGTNFEAALTAMAEKGKMSHVRKITDGNGVNKVTHYIIKSNEAFKGEYNTKKDNEAGENFEVFIKDAFKGIHFEKEKRDPSNMNTISGIPGIGYWEDPNTKNSWIHRDVDVFMGKKNTIEVTLSTTSDGKQVEAIDTDGNSKTRDVDSSFVEVKAGQVDWNLLKDKSDGSPGELSRGNLIAIKYTASYNILISKTNFTLRPELEKMMARYGMTWILILNENGYIAFPKD